MGGSGTIAHLREQAYLGWTQNTATLTLGSDIDVTVSAHAPGAMARLEVQCHLVLNGTMTIDGVDEGIDLGPVSGTGVIIDLSGAGSIHVADGVLRLRSAELQTTTPTWILSGGTTFITAHANNLVSNLTLPITMTGGLLHVRTGPFQTTANCSLRGGSITVDQGYTARFETPP